MDVDVKVGVDGMVNATVEVDVEVSTSHQKKCGR